MVINMIAKLIKLIRRILIGLSLSERFRKFGEQELPKFKKAYEELMGVLDDVKEKR